jgi:hypothetical protein
MTGIVSKDQDKAVLRNELQAQRISIQSCLHTHRLPSDQHTTNSVECGYLPEMREAMKKWEAFVQSVCIDSAVVSQAA